MSVLLIAETNWLENIVLAQDSTSAYLFRLARTEIKRVLDEIKSMVRIIPYTTNVSTMAEMMFESASPPFKEGDCRIYTSILAFVEHTGEKYDSILFYTEDKEDFDHPEIHVELGNSDVEIMFDSGACVERIRE